jgi:hypothetical protein
MSVRFESVRRAATSPPHHHWLSKDNDLCQQPLSPLRCNIPVTTHVHETSESQFWSITLQRDGTSRRREGRVWRVNQVLEALGEWVSPYRGLWVNRKHEARSPTSFHTGTDFVPRTCAMVATDGGKLCTPSIRETH